MFSFGLATSTHAEKKAHGLRRVLPTLTTLTGLSMLGSQEGQSRHGRHGLLLPRIASGKRRSETHWAPLGLEFCGDKSLSISQ